MNEGTGLLWTALILTIGALGSLLPLILSGSKTYRNLSRVLIALSFALVSLVFLLVIYYFLTSNMAIAYVHANSKTDYPWYYKLAGAWSGDDGSILLWVWMLSLVTLIFSLERKSDSKQRATFRIIASVIMLTILAALIYLLIVADPFRPTAPIYLVSQDTMNGLGMSPLLLTPLVIIHPPLEFAAYALLAVPFASALANLAVGRSQWTRVSMQWTRAAWMFLTLAILIGALWAYSVLGWGGYWAWDPVETSNLVVWLPLTALVHASLWNRRKGQFAHLAPALAGTSFALALFATFETRTGIILSVHSFTGSFGAASNDLGGRLLTVLRNGGPVPIFYTLMLISLLVTAALFMLYFARLRRREGRTTGVMAVVPYLFLAVFAVAAIWVLYDSHGITSIVVSLAGSLSIGLPALGLMILAGIFIGIPLIWMLATSPTEERPGRRLSEYVNDDWMMNVALVLFVLWTLVTLALMVIGANALNPADFEGRLPFLLIPVGAVLFAILTWRYFSKDWLPVALIVLSLAVILSFAMMSSNFGALYIPLVLALVFAVGLRICKVWAPALLSKNLRTAAVLNLVSLLLAFVMWSSNAAATGLPLVSSSVLLSIGLSIAAIATILVMALAIGRHDMRLWIASCLLGIAFLGYFIGSAFSLTAIILVILSRKQFMSGAVHRRMSFTSITRGASPQFVHLGVALLVLGYAASAYFATESSVVTFTDVATSTSHGYEYRLVSSSGVDVDNDGRYEVINAEVDVTNSGAHAFSLAMKVTWQTEAVNYDHYLSEPVIRSGPAGDLYFTFIGFGTATGEYAITDQPNEFGQGPYKTDNATLTTAWFQVRQNPLMPALWAGGWLMAIGMVMRIWSERSLYQGHRPEEQGPFETPATPPPSIPAVEQRDEEYYRRLLEEEIKKGEGQE